MRCPQYPFLIGMTARSSGMKRTKEAPARRNEFLKTVQVVHTGTHNAQRTTLSLLQLEPEATDTKNRLKDGQEK